MFRYLKGVIQGAWREVKAAKHNTLSPDLTVKATKMEGRQEALPPETLERETEDQLLAKDQDETKCDEIEMSDTLLEEEAPISWSKSAGDGAAADAQPKLVGLSGDASTSEVACHIEIHTDPEQVVVASLDEPKPAQEGADDYDNEGLTLFDRELLRQCPSLAVATLTVQPDTKAKMDTLPMSDVAKATEAKESVPSPDAIEMGDSAKAEKPKDSTKTRAPKKG